VAHRGRRRDRGRWDSLVHKLRVAWSLIRLQLVC
jgi:hypothetical protein